MGIKSVGFSNYILRIKGTMYGRHRHADVKQWLEFIILLFEFRNEMFGVFINMLIIRPTPEIHR